MADFLACFSGIAIDEVLDQHGDIFSTLTQRWNGDGKDVQPVIKVAAKRAGSDGGLQIAIGSGNYANVGPYLLMPTHSFEFSLLQNAQQSYLGFIRKLA